VWVFSGVVLVQREFEAVVTWSIATAPYHIWVVPELKLLNISKIQNKIGVEVQKGLVRPLDWAPIDVTMPHGRHPLSAVGLDGPEEQRGLFEHLGKMNRVGGGCRIVQATGMGSMFCRL